MLKTLRWLLLPFSIVYDIVTRLRNFGFDTGLKKSTSFQLPVICIGNITVGGTGKTPHTEHLANLLLPNHKTAIISRGYKRLTKGVVVANSQSKASDVGDEPFQMHQKFKDLTIVAAEKRVDGIAECLKQSPAPDVILLDDAYQHRHVEPGLTILLIDYNRPIWKDYLLPAGNLREAASAKRRADIVVITKCPPTLTDFQQKKILRKLNRFDEKRIFFSGFNYGNPYSLSDSKQDYTINRDSTVLLVSGIANPKPLYNYISRLTPNVTQVIFSDHHNFDDKDIQLIIRKFNALPESNKIIITTEKDAVRLKELNLLPNEIVKETYVIPIEVQFFFDQTTEFNEQILEYVRENKSNQ